MVTWATAPPRVGMLLAEAWGLAQLCRVRARLERPPKYLEGLGILLWLQRLMDLCGEPWCLSGEVFGSFLGIKQPQASQYLKLAREEGLLEKTCNLTPAEAKASKQAYSYVFHVDRGAPPPGTNQYQWLQCDPWWWKKEEY